MCASIADFSRNELEIARQPRTGLRTGWVAVIPNASIWVYKYDVLYTHSWLPKRVIRSVETWLDSFAATHLCSEAPNPGAGDTVGKVTNPEHANGEIRNSGYDRMPQGSKAQGKAKLDYLRTNHVARDLFQHNNNDKSHIPTGFTHILQQCLFLNIRLQR